MSEEISIQNFQKLDLRIGKIKEADPVPDTDNLIKLIVNWGETTSQAVAGLKPHYTPESLVGKQVVVLTNLETAEIHGIRSEVMILAGVEKGESGKEETIGIIVPDKHLPAGTKIF